VDTDYCWLVSIWRGLDIGFAAFSILPDYIPLDMQVASSFQATILCACASWGM
jgi:hypothetical protein